MPTTSMSFRARKCFVAALQIGIDVVDDRELRTRFISGRAEHVVDSTYTSARHVSKPSLVSTSTAYMNLPATNSARVITGIGARTYCCSRCRPLIRRIVISAGKVVGESVYSIEQANAEPLAAAVRLEDHRADIEIAARGSKQPVMASNKDRPWGSSSRRLRARRTCAPCRSRGRAGGPLNDVTAMSCQPSKYSGAQFGRVAMTRGCARSELPPNWWTPLLSSEGSGKVSNGPGTASFYG